jgi:hypothetical protein
MHIFIAAFPKIFYIKVLYSNIKIPVRCKYCTALKFLLKETPSLDDTESITFVKKHEN